MYFFNSCWNFYFFKPLTLSCSNIRHQNFSDSIFSGSTVLLLNQTISILLKNVLLFPLLFDLFFIRPSYNRFYYYTLEHRTVNILTFEPFTLNLLYFCQPQLDVLDFDLLTISLSPKFAAAFNRGARDFRQIVTWKLELVISEKKLETESENWRTNRWMELSMSSLVLKQTFVISFHFVFQFWLFSLLMSVVVCRSEVGWWPANSEAGFKQKPVRTKKRFDFQKKVQQFERFLKSAKLCRQK